MVGKVGEVVSVTLVEQIKPELSMCKLGIDFDEIYMFGDYNEIIQYSGKTVLYETRPDIWKGNEVIVIAEIGERKVVQTVDSILNKKLIPEIRGDRAICNFAINSLNYGDSDFDCIGFLASVELGSSQRARWADCTVIDREGKAFILRFFTSSSESGAESSEEVVTALVGNYIKFGVTYSKYGYQADSIELYSVDVVEPPEVAIAVSVIEDAVSEDKELMAYMDKYNFISNIRKVIDYEVGYNLVNIAAEIYIINAVCDISDVYDRRLLIRSAVTSRGYLLPSKGVYSRVLLNFNKLMMCKELSVDRELISILDVVSEVKPTQTKSMYIGISKFVYDIMQDRRSSLNEETDKHSNDVSGLRSIYGQLL